MSGCTWVATVLIAVCGLVPAVLAQGSAEDVHIAPRAEHAQAQNNPLTEDPALKTLLDTDQGRREPGPRLGVDRGSPEPPSHWAG